jgi:hypothetical protein
MEPTASDEEIPMTDSGGVPQATTTAANARPKATLQHRAAHEFKELLIVTAYLYVTLGAVIVMKAAVLHTQGIESAVWGVAIVKAVVLAKFMLIGHAVKLGERDTTRPLIWPTLYRTFLFLLLLIAMTIVEEAVVGLFHGQSIAISLGDLFGRRLLETLAGYLIMLLVLIPYFAFRVLGEVLGEGRLTRMFFVARDPVVRQ